MSRNLKIFDNNQDERKLESFHSNIAAIYSFYFVQHAPHKSQ